MSDPAAAIVHAGDTGPATGSPTVTAMVPGPTKIATGVATSASKPREHRVVRGDTLVSISRRYSCDTKTLAKANNLKAPRYAISQGHSLKLASCKRSARTRARPANRPHAQTQERSPPQELRATISSQRERGQRGHPPRSPGKRRHRC